MEEDSEKSPWEEREEKENNPFNALGSAMEKMMVNPEMQKERISRMAISLIDAGCKPEAVVRIAFEIEDEINKELERRQKKD